MTKSELDTLDSVFLAPLALFVNQYFGTIFSERKLLWICMVRIFYHDIIIAYITYVMAEAYCKFRYVVI